MTTITSPPFTKVSVLAQGSLGSSSQLVQIPFDPTGVNWWECTFQTIPNNSVAGYIPLDIRFNNLSTNIYTFGVERNTQGVLTTVVPAAAGAQIRSNAFAGSSLATPGTIVKVRGGNPTIDSFSQVDIDVIGSTVKGNFVRDKILGMVNIAAAITEIDFSAVSGGEFFSASFTRWLILGYGK